MSRRVDSQCLPGRASSAFAVFCAAQVSEAEAHLLHTDLRRLVYQLVLTANFWRGTSSSPNNACSVNGCQLVTSITATFNGTAINTGRYIWSYLLPRPDRTKAQCERHCLADRNRKAPPAGID